MPQSTALPSAWIERLFARLQALYGNRVATVWGDVPAGEIKAVWGEALGAFAADDLRRALEACIDAHVDYPPTLPQFVRLCRDARKVRAANAVKLPSPPGVPCPPEIRAQIGATIRHLRVGNVVPVRLTQAGPTDDPE